MFAASNQTNPNFAFHPIRTFRGVSSFHPLRSLGAAVTIG
jgi:hypothetical protein